MTDRAVRLYSIMIVLVVLISAASNMIYASYQVVPKPLFTAINDEMVYNETFDEKLTVSYITNNSDTRRLESIYFDELDSGQLVSQTGYFSGFVFSGNTNDNPYNDIIGRYYTLKSGYIDLYLTETDINRLKENGSLTFGSGMAMMDDGSTIPVSLGRITIHTNDHWDHFRLRESGGGSNDNFDMVYKTEKPIQITSIDLSSFEPHQEAMDMELIVDNDKVYTYDDLITGAESIMIDRGFQVKFTAKDPDVSSQWRFNMISMDMSYEKDGQSYDTWIHYPFYGSGMDEDSVEAYVKLRRSENE